ncbi:uncharacterized protein HMPREF1541_08835 [Cyphellophora europaea CBS 101466]|uniref:CID domain-containing protein n=1 Tax=Cyphellophora europaea (strain CBS 101466) TaxID=1220924 RepID=W2RJ85_CYPE1|nr:uncharacterized protein HMPREF1541_08835 [Cyphellophora europaea CBS 101466]ETN36557.1 hypothetical protein HMPREF1541_08835 [Cyphellophora europaea CBS 101466]
MASHHLTVAKATFAASLLRPDVIKIDREETCKQWLLENIVPSASRTSAFVKYATARVRHASAPEDSSSKTSQYRQRLHCLYLLHDLLHHAKYHAHNPTIQSNLTQACQASAVEIFRLAASENKPKIRGRLHNLVNIWEADEFFAPDLLNQIRKSISDPSAHVSENEASTATTLVPKEIPFMMPASHGEPGLPFHELPAGNLMPHIHPNKTIPMRPDAIRPLQFSAGPADESLVNAIKDFLKDVDGIEGTFQHFDDEGIVPDIDDLGQLTYTNEAGEVVGDTYYGWSRSFCEKMKARRNTAFYGASGTNRSRSYSSSRSRSSSPRKRRRYSDSSPERSSSRRYSKPAFQRPSSPEHAGLAVSQVRYSATDSRPEGIYGAHQQPQQVPASSSFDSQAFASATPRMPSLPVPPLGADGLPLPPPKPPNWSGPWPPLPPPPPPPAPSHYQPRGGFPPYDGR